jgi:hypothetical protein
LLRAEQEGRERLAAEIKQAALKEQAEKELRAEMKAKLEKL